MTDRRLPTTIVPVILRLGPTPAAQRVMVFRQFTLDAVNRAVTTLDCAAGKAGNGAKVLKSLGERPVLTGFLGGERGEMQKSQLEGKGIELSFVPVAAHTRQCLTVIDQSAGTQTELVEESQPVAAADYKALEVFVRQLDPGRTGGLLLPLRETGESTPTGPAV